MAIEMNQGRERERRRRSAKAQAIVAALAAGGPRRAIELLEQQLELRLIKGSEQTLAKARAHEALEKAGLAGKSDSQGDLNRFLMIECLAFSIVEPGATEPLFHDGDELQQTIDETLLGSLLISYAELSAEGEAAMSDMLLRKQVRELLEKKSWTELSDIAPRLPRASLITTVVQLSNSLAQRS